MKETFENWKMRLQLVLYAVLVALVVSLVVYPPFVANRLGTTFKAMAANGIKLKFVVFGVTVEQSAGQQEAVEQGAKLDQVRLEAGCLADQSCTPNQQKALAGLLSIEAAQTFKIAASNAIAFPEWVVVVGADRTQNAARDELRKIVGQANSQKTGLILRDGWFRTVAYYPTSDQAKSALPELEALVGNGGSYIRSLTLWCEGQIGEKDAEVATCG